MNQAELIAADKLSCFIAALQHKKPLQQILWLLYENDTDTSKEIAKQHPELEAVMQEIRAIYEKEISNPLQRIAVLMKEIERVSPKQ